MAKTQPLRKASARTIAISQSNYVPWRGYFDLIGAVDQFIFYDDVQYTKNDWRNRNRIKTPSGPQWLTIPVGSDWHRRIVDVSIAHPACGSRHWKTLHANYARAPHYEAVATWLKPLYDEDWTSLSEINQRLTAAICAVLGIDTVLSRSADFDVAGDRNGRLLELCRATGADTYLSGPSAASYLDVDAFARAGIEVVWMDYTGYPPYPQLWGAFEGAVSVLDLLFNCGDEARRYMKVGAA